MSFDQDPNERANISGADYAQMLDHIQQIESVNSVLRAQLEESRANDRTAMLWIAKIKDAAQYDGDLPSLIQHIQDLSPNAEWLTLAHALCSDLGAPHGHIADRLRYEINKSTIIRD